MTKGLNGIRTLPALSAVVGMMMFCVSTFAAGEQRANPRASQAMAVDDRTIFLLQADAAKNSLVDKTGAFSPVVEGGTVIDDETWGTCLRLGDGEKNGITVPDGGKMSFDGGMTFEAWIRLEEPMPKRGSVLARKAGSFSCSITGAGKFNCDWMNFPTQKIFTTTKKQYKYYPVGGTMFNGLMTVPIEKWVYMAIAYDQERSAVYTWINGMPDRYRYRIYDRQPLLCNPRSPLRILSGIKNCTVAAVRLSRGMRRVGPVPAMEVYVNQLPYQGKVMLTFDHIDPSLAFPLDVTIVWEKPTGPSNTLETITLDSAEKKDVFIELSGWKWGLHTLHVNVCSGTRMVYSRTVRVANSRPRGPVKINEDNSVSVNKKKIFPLVIYDALPEDFPLLGELGFNVVYNGHSLWMLQGKMKKHGDPNFMPALLKENLKAARANGLMLMVNGNIVFNKLPNIPPVKDNPALLGWYGFDEPWGDLRKVQESYSVVKVLDPNRPIFVVQNNRSRLQETAEGADILSVDPYPIPNVSLRDVVEATKAAVRAVSGRKPVWTVIPQYVRKIPTREELRSMAYLAVAAGANGVGVYTWGTQRNHPEQIEDLRAVIGELSGIEPILVIPNSERRTAFTPANPALHAAIKEADGKRWLLIASDSRRAEESVLSIEGIADAEGRCLHDGGKNENIRITDGQVSVKLPPLGAAVYEILSK